MFAFTGVPVISNACSGSVPPVQVMMKRLVARRQPRHGSPMTAIPRTAAILASTGLSTKQPLLGSQRESATPHPTTAAAAKLHLERGRSLQGCYAQVPVMNSCRSRLSVIAASSARTAVVLPNRSLPCIRGLGHPSTVCIDGSWRRTPRAIRYPSTSSGYKRASHGRSRWPRNAPC